MTRLFLTCVKSCALKEDYDLVESFALKKDSKIIEKIWEEYMSNSSF